LHTNFRLDFDTTATKGTSDISNPDWWKFLKIVWENFAIQISKIPEWNFGILIFWGFLRFDIEILNFGIFWSGNRENGRPIICNYNFYILYA